MTVRRLTLNLALLLIGLNGFYKCKKSEYLPSLPPPPQSPLPLILMELFTSQGCSSCPPADRYFAELAEEDSLAVLSWHVPYWDYIGWKDPFALQESEIRQKRYAHRFGMSRIYTPQAIVGGKLQYVGSNKHELRRILQELRKERNVRIPRLYLRRKEGSDKRAFSIRVSQKKGNAKSVEARGAFDILLVLFQSFAETSVKRGENRDRRLRNSNIVRSVKSLGRWDGIGEKLFSFRLLAGDKDFDVLHDGGIVVILEPRRGKGTAGVARLDFKRGIR